LNDDQTLQHTTRERPSPTDDTDLDDRIRRNLLTMTKPGPEGTLDHAAGSSAGLIVHLTKRTFVARNIAMLDLSPADGVALPLATPGAHIDIHVPNRGTRQYSLVTAGHGKSYTVVIKREETGRGGSIYLVEEAAVGDKLEVSAPRNNFLLLENSPHSVLIAGGIGITPIYSMSQRLLALGASWRMHVACKTRRDAVFASELQLLHQVQFHFSGESEGVPLDIEAVVAASPSDAHIYCCGPPRMLQAFERAMAGRRADLAHVEHFAAGRQSAPGGFSIRIRSSSQVLPVPIGSSILDALEAAGISVPSSCRDGVCGACQVGVIDGIPDHRDSVLSMQEKEANDAIMVCCSGSSSKVLTLDL
jgi:tetrachlorobenzoquinone reductase